MSNWGTAVATIRRRTHKAASEDGNIKAAICDAVALLRRESLRWNQARFALTLTATQATYELNAVGAVLATKLPSTLLKIIGKKLDLDYTGLADSRTPVMWVPRETMESMRRGTPVDGEPAYWTFWDEKLELCPASDASTYILSGAYIADVGTPTYSATTADPPVYTFTQPDGSTAMTDAFTNPWFDQRAGFNIVTWKAEWDLWTSFWQATAGQDERAGMKYADALAAAQEISDAQSSGRQVQVFDPGDW